MDYEVDEIWKEPKKKKIKSGAKGKGAEREICKILNERFSKLLSEHADWGTFSRTVGSGNRWGQGVNLSAQAKDTYSGDICVPPTFKWVIESKKGYNDIDLCAAFSGKCRELDEFLAQVQDDAERTGRQPMLVWKKDRKPRLGFVRTHTTLSYAPSATTMFYYNGSRCFPEPEYRTGWLAVPLETLLALPDSFWFAEPTDIQG